MFGISYFSAVVNPPQAAILAVGGGVPRVIPPKAAGEKPRTVTTVTVQLSADRRVVDEAIAAQFLQVRIDVHMYRRTDTTMHLCRYIHSLFVLSICSSCSSHLPLLMLFVPLILQAFRNYLSNPKSMLL
jgi:hypothetical protein